MKIWKVYISEDVIRSGASIELDKYDLSYEARKVFENYIQTYEGHFINEDLRFDPYVMNSFIETYPELVVDVINRKIIEQMNDYQKILNRLENSNVLYYFANGETEVKNTPMGKLDFMNRDVYIIFDNLGYQTPYGFNNYYQFDKLNLNTDIVFVSFTDNSLKSLSDQWQSDRKQMRLYLLILVVTIIVLIFCLIILLKNILSFEWVISNLYLEVIGAVLAYLIPMSSYIVAASQEMPSDTHVIIFAILISSISVYGLLMIYKHIKTYKLKHTITYKLAKNIIGILRKSFESLPFMVRMIPNFKNARDFKMALDLLNKIEEGQFDIEYESKSQGLYKQLIDSINHVNLGLQQAVHNELKSEKMKSELISNVSHDLRTPLTSIVSYLDLLNKESDESKRQDYLNILNQKTSRLDILIEDLFDE